MSTKNYTEYPFFLAFYFFWANIQVSERDNRKLYSTTFSNRSGTKTEIYKAEEIHCPKVA